MKKIIPLLLLVFFACKKTDNPVVAIQLSDMRVKVGNSWSYVVTNYPATETDTAVYKLTGSFVPFVGNNVMFNTQTSIKGIAVDSGLLELSDSSISYVAYNGVQTYAGSGLFDGWQLMFPLSSTSSYTVNGANFKVIASGQNLTVAGNNYTNVYTLLRSSITPNGTVYDTLLIAPHVGILKWHGFPLVSYHLQ